MDDPETVVIHGNGSPDGSDWYDSSTDPEKNSR